MIQNSLIQHTEMKIQGPANSQSLKAVTALLLTYQRPQAQKNLFKFTDMFCSLLFLLAHNKTQLWTPTPALTSAAHSCDHQLSPIARARAALENGSTLQNKPLVGIVALKLIGKAVFASKCLYTKELHVEVSAIHGQKILQGVAKQAAWSEPPVSASFS